MKIKKILLSFFSIFLSGVFMIGIFSSSVYKKPAQANVKIDGVKGKIYEFSENIIDKFNYTQQNNGENTPRVVTKVCLGGFPVGLKLYANGVVVVDTESVDTENGAVDTAKRAGIMVGDIIKKVNGTTVTSNKEVSTMIEQSNGEEMEFQVERNGAILNLTFKTAFSVSENKYKAGIWIRDSSAGIGTVTFCTQEGFFASLGHAVCDIDTKQVIPISQGETTNVTIANLIKGRSGAAGELCGYLENEKTGEVYYNGALGVYGRFDNLPATSICEIAYADEVVEGEATMYTTLENGKIEAYSIRITSIDRKSADNKNLMIKIVDENLINKTGGIIQGMSGSPIVQNGKLIGAVTHVFLDDATGGYGIFAETMLQNIKNISQEQLQKAS